MYVNLCFSQIVESAFIEIQHRRDSNSCSSGVHVKIIVSNDREQLSPSFSEQSHPMIFQSAKFNGTIKV